MVQHIALVNRSPPEWSVLELHEYREKEDHIPSPATGRAVSAHQGRTVTLPAVPTLINSIPQLKTQY